ncbi:DNA-3-methyladenine glycosylase 2 family protein, partial [Proteus mirabilis]
MRLYRHQSLDRTRFERYRKRYSPYGSTASLYLWTLSKESAD